MLNEDYKEMLQILLNNKVKFLIVGAYAMGAQGYPQIRVYHKNGSGKKIPRYLLKCDCCDEKLEIYYDDEGREDLTA